ncbi:MAG TPA: hypothetical protein VK494_07895, partial [Gemmatimonadaceae bacterium]|nr:hypothetical protein [Gemmatimonadaceae bacterium]
DGTNVWFVGYTADLVAGVWMGLDRPSKIKDNAQGGVLAAPAWTAFMTEVYRRKPTPPDWPKPISIVTREIDISSGLLQTPYCPRNLVASEFYISGTEPTRDCDKHGPYANPGLMPIDTFSRIPPTPPLDGAVQRPPTVTPPPVQPGYEPVPSRGQPPRTPTVFDTTTRRDTIRRLPVSDTTTLRDGGRRPTVFDTTRRAPRRDTIRRDSTTPRTDTIPSARAPTLLLNPR